MAEYSAIVQFGRDIQQTLIPIENRKPSLASACSHFIEDMTHIEEEAPFMDRMMKEIGARIGVIAMPFFVSLSVIQLGGAFACHLTLMIVNWDWDVDLLTDYAVQIAKMVVDVFAQIIIFPIAIVAPTVYRYEPYTPPRDPKDVEIEDLNLQLVQKEQQLIARDQALLPQITLATFDDLEDTINEMPGISAKKWEYEVSEDPELYFSTWEPKGIDKIPIRSFEKFLCPPDTLELTLDFDEPLSKQDSLVRFLQKGHKIDRLILKGHGSLNFLLNLPENNTTLHNIHTLVIEEFEITKDFLIGLSRKFPNIACYYLNEAVIDEEVPEFRGQFIYYEPRVKGKVSFARNNLQDLYDDFNLKAKAFSEGYSAAGFGDRHWLTPLPGIKLLHPIAPFIRRVAFLKGTEVREGHLHGIRNGLKTFFPNMRVLDLSECHELTVGTFTTLAMLHPDEVRLVGCKRLLLERLDRDGIIELLGTKGLQGEKQAQATDRVFIKSSKDTDVIREFPEDQGFIFEFSTRKDAIRKCYAPARDKFAAAAIKYFINGGNYLKMNDVPMVHPVNAGFHAVIPALALRDESRMRNVRLSYYNTEHGENREVHA